MRTRRRQIAHVFFLSLPIGMISSTTFGILYMRTLQPYTTIHH